MWFYMKYIVKNHSDRMLLARLCTFASWVGHLTTKPSFIGWSFRNAAKTTIFASFVGLLTRTSQNNDIRFICWTHTPNKDIASWVGPLTRTSQNNDIGFICWSYTPNKDIASWVGPLTRTSQNNDIGIISGIFNTDIPRQRYSL
jgi:hypothetical protein